MVLSVAKADDRVKIDFYSEAFWPGCEGVYLNSVAKALKADGFLEMCDLNVWPYGNAHEVQRTDGSWSFSCQHGPAECVFNTLEACAINLIDDKMDTLNFIVCVEEELHKNNRNIKEITTTCAEGNEQPLLDCYASDQGNKYQHAIAAATEALNPKHKYVPWIVVDGHYDTTKAN